MPSALIVADLQRGITERFDFASAAVPAAAAAITIARESGILMIFVRVALRPDGIDVGPRNALFRTFLEMGEMMHEGATDTLPDPRLGVRHEDVVITKRRTSAFAGSDLDIVLRANDVNSIVVCGAATSAVIAATAYDAADRDLPITVLADACGDPDPEVHDFLTQRLFPLRAWRVQTVAEWKRSLF